MSTTRTIWVATWVPVSLLIGCSQYLPCPGSEEDCACVEDRDCEATVYHQPVSSTEDCYDPACLCAMPVNDEAAARNEAAWLEYGCDAEVTGDCVECVTRYAGAVTCRDGWCHKWRGPSGEDADPEWTNPLGQ